MYNNVVYPVIEPFGLLQQVYTGVGIFLPFKLCWLYSCGPFLDRNADAINTVALAAGLTNM